MYDSREIGELPARTRIALILLFALAALSGMYWGYTVAGPFLAG